MKRIAMVMARTRFKKKNETAHAWVAPVSVMFIHIPKQSKSNLKFSPIEQFHKIFTFFYAVFVGFTFILTIAFSHFWMTNGMFGPSFGNVIKKRFIRTFIPHCAFKFCCRCACFRCQSASQQINCTLNENKFTYWKIRENSKFFPIF